MKKTPQEAMQNYIEVKDFLNNNNVLNHDSILSNFDAWVEYESKIGSPHGQATIEVKMDGYGSEGDIEIIGSAFDPNRIHTGFSTEWQTYHFDRVHNKLIISGNSPKMDGKYTVSISIASNQ